MNSVLLNKTNIKQILSRMLINYIAKKANVCKHSGVYDQSSHILESCLLSHAY